MAQETDLQTWRARWAGQVQSEDELVRFVNDIGLCTIDILPRWPEFPSQGTAMGRVDVLGPTWFWKDDLHTQRRLYYTRVFGGKPGYLSLAWVPAFIAACGEVLDELEMTGGLPATTLEIARTVEEYGPISTVKLKKLLAPDARKASAAALIELERRYIVTKTDITGREMNTYSYVWDMTERWMPEAFIAADRLKRQAARRQITEHLRLLGVDPSPDFLKRVLRWQG